MAEVRLDGLGKVYADGTIALSNLDLVLADGELLVLVGPSGCGKTTALRMVAGLEQITTGTITIGSRVVNRLSESDRDIAMVFQNYALYPHMSVYENIAFPLKLARLKRAERDQRVRQVAELLGLSGHLKQKPGQLSGGQRQRVAMGRAIVRKPQVFLMDEPLSNLDAKLRVQMRADILELQRRLGITTLYVTHDQAEAMTLGDRVAVLRNGELQQVGPPEVVYDSPANLFVATFLGSPPMNLLRGRLVGDERSAAAIAIGDLRVSLDALEHSRYPALERMLGADVVMGIRPESLEVGPGDARGLRGMVTLRESIGSDVYVRFRLPEAESPDSSLSRLAHDAEEAEQLEETADRYATLIARLPASTTVDRGQFVSLVTSPGALRLFDAESGRSLADVQHQPIEPRDRPQSRVRTIE